MFSVNSDVEESATRSEEISLDYDFFHSHLLPLSCGQDYTAKIVPRDINVWISRLFLGDADGFSILYYQDVDSLVYWANEAAYHAWLCGTYNKKGKAGCDAKLIQECVLETITAEVMGLPEFDGRAFRAEVKEIQVQDNNSLVFVFYDGRRAARTWANPDRRYGRRSKSCQQ